MPDLSNRPLLSEGPDLDLFVPREPAESLLLRGVRAELNVLVTGPGGAGKTTLLHRLEGALRTAPFNRPIVFVSGSLADDAQDLLELIAEELSQVAAPRSPRMARATVNGRGARRLLDTVRALRTQEGALILLDDVPSGETGVTLFGRLRDELWQLPHRWVVTARTDVSTALALPPADAFFELKVALSPLSRSETADLLARRGVSGVGEDVLDRIASQSEGNPLVALMLARRVLLDPERADRVLTARHRRHEAAAELGRSASMLVAELEKRGPTSASDPDLLKALGWTRSRATQVLRELEKRGLARSFPGDSNNRRLYELVDSGSM